VAPQASAQPENGNGPPDDPPVGLDIVHPQVAAGQEHVMLYVVPSLHDSLASTVHGPPSGPPLLPPAIVCLHTGPTPASMPTVGPHSGGADGFPVHGTHV
jgi:hypothetical protein